MYVGICCCCRPADRRTVAGRRAGGPEHVGISGLFVPVGMCRAVQRASGAVMEGEEVSPADVFHEPISFVRPSHRIRPYRTSYIRAGVQLAVLVYVIYSSSAIDGHRLVMCLLVMCLPFMPRAALSIPPVAIDPRLRPILSSSHRPSIRARTAKHPPPPAPRHHPPIHPSIHPSIQLPSSVHPILPSSHVQPSSPELSSFIPSHRPSYNPARTSMSHVSSPSPPPSAHPPIQWKGPWTYMGVCRRLIV